MAVEVETLRPTLTERIRRLGRKRTLPPNGHVHAPDLTPAIQAEMTQKIAERCLADFFTYDIPVVHLAEVSRERDWRRLRRDHV